MIPSPAAKEIEAKVGRRKTVLGGSGPKFPRVANGGIPKTPFNNFTFEGSAFETGCLNGPVEPTLKP